ncbi:hypothetical protein COOONC_20734 [Cooperia oncophora]
MTAKSKKSARTARAASLMVDKTMAAKSSTSSLINVNTAVQQKTTHAAAVADSLVTQPGEPQSVKRPLDPKTARGPVTDPNFLTLKGLAKTMADQQSVKGGPFPPPPEPAPAPLAEPLPISMTAIGGEGQYEDVDVIPDAVLETPPPPPPPAVKPKAVAPVPAAKKPSTLPLKPPAPPLRPAGFAAAPKPSPKPPPAAKPAAKMPSPAAAKKK